MNTRYFHIGLAIWIFAVVPLGFAESFPNRPTAGEMDKIVELGTECVRGVNERCWATQYQTDPVAYRVAPFTNTAGFHLDQSLMDTMASKIRSLVPYYVDPDTVYNGTTNISMLTTNGLWARLEIGDHTNKFTCTPAIGTNAATYGDNPGKIYIEDLQERYKVLNALKVTSAVRKASINGSHAHSFGMVWRQDLTGQHWTNTVTGAIDNTYKPYSYADLLGLPNGYNYSINADWQVYYYDFGEFYHKMSYAEYKQYFTWYWFHATDSPMGPPPYTPYPDGYIDPVTNEVGNGAGDFWAVKKSIYVGGNPVHAWYWDYEFQIDYSTWVFDSQYSGQQLTNTASIYLKPTLASGYWTPASNWDLTAEGRFEELAGLPPNVYSKLDETFVDKVSNVWSVVFGSDEFGPLNSADSQPAYPDAPTEPTLSDQSDFVGTARGLRLEPNNYFFLKTWQFNYCTE